MDSEYTYHNWVEKANEGDNVGKMSAEVRGLNIDRAGQKAGLLSEGPVYVDTTLI